MPREKKDTPEPSAFERMKEFTRTTAQRTQSEIIPPRANGRKPRSYDIVSERDLSEGVTKLAALRTTQVAAARTVVLPFGRTETEVRQSGGRGA
jgi:hypothetical protein